MLVTSVGVNKRQWRQKSAGNVSRGKQASVGAKNSGNVSRGKKVLVTDDKRQ